jgi:hypothetical protein
VTKTVRLRESKSLLRRRYIANQLVEGPHSFHPPKSAREYGWLEPTLRFVIGEFPANRRSFAVFSDDSMNKYTNLFTPMIRIATWRRAEESTHRGRWPLVDVRWGYLRRGRARVDRFIRRLVRALGRLKLGDGGLYDRRRSTPSAMKSTLGDFSLMVRTEALQLELSGTALRGDTLPRLIMDGCQLLEDVCAPAPLRGWTECYDQEFSATNLVVRSHWKWLPKRGA